MDKLISRTENRPILIAGPCSAETREQVIEIAKQLSTDDRVTSYRAGIWKPRTRPGSFEGVGSIGLKWMQEAKEITGLPTTVEVAKAVHVEEALAHGVDMLWIGARTTVNPFAVQEIADALKGVDVPVLIKNPINPDLGLWIGAVERIAQAGIRSIGAIHRGFSNTGEKIFRNRPQWQIPIEFKERLPEIPMINDPSHICGNRHMIKGVSQKALDLNYDGLMIETHINPDEAWSDAKQQITPNALKQMLDDLTLRVYDPEREHNDTELDRLRKEIDFVDDELLNLLANRMNIARSIGEYKKENNIMILQSNRWKDIQKKFTSRAENLDLSRNFISKVIKAIHDESIDQQEKINSTEPSEQ